jgi:hypothetical protein
MDAVYMALSNGLLNIVTQVQNSVAVASDSALASGPLAYDLTTRLSAIAALIPPTVRLPVQPSALTATRSRSMSLGTAAVEGGANMVVFASLVKSMRRLLGPYRPWIVNGSPAQVTAVLMLDATLEQMLVPMFRNMLDVDHNMPATTMSIQFGFAIKEHLSDYIDSLRPATPLRDRLALLQQAQQQQQQQQQQAHPPLQSAQDTGAAGVTSEVVYLADPVVEQ